MSAQKPQVISASRRTDIPAFYGEWFLNRLRAGRVVAYNPFGGQRYEVSLRREDVAGIVFWSKNFAPFLPALSEIERRGYPFYLQYTITGLPRSLEPNVPDWTRSIDAFRELASRYRPEAVQWRFDPIVLTDGITPQVTLDRFRRIADALAGLTHRCYLSFMDPYAKVRRNMATYESESRDRVLEPDPQLRNDLAARLAREARARDMRLLACCEADLVGEGIERGRCVDGRLLRELFPGCQASVELRPTREGCGCTASRDIGAYDTCPHGCLYCYANANKDIALRAHVDPEGESLSAH